jgi:hypothetical protein
MAGGGRTPQHVEKSVKNTNAACDGEEDGVPLDEYALRPGVTLCERAKYRKRRPDLHLVALAFMHRAPRLVQPKAEARAVRGCRRGKRRLKLGRWGGASGPW